MLFGFLAPVSAAVKSELIGRAMLEVTVRDDDFGNGDKLGTRSILRLSNAYERRNRLGFHLHQILISDQVRPYQRVGRFDMIEVPAVHP